MKTDNPNTRLTRDKIFEDTLKTYFRRYIKPNENFIIATELSHECAYLQLILDDTNQSHKLELELCVKCEDNNIENPTNAFDQATCALQNILLDYFQNDRILHLTPDWNEYEHENIKILAKALKSYPQLDNLADEFLNKHGFAPNAEPLDK